MLLVLKYGGNAMGARGAPDPILDEVADFVQRGNKAVVVHGGGPHIDAALAERNIVTARVGGLRVTDSETLSITESVLCGTVNKALVRALHARGARAAGICGQDGGLLLARFADATPHGSLGYVGEIVEVHPAILEGLLCAGMLPVVAPLAMSVDGATALNVNADTAAGAIAGVLGADIYVVATNVEAVRLRADDPTTAIRRLTTTQTRRYLADGTFAGGMRPKMQSVLDAFERGVRRAIVVGAGPAVVRRALAGDGTTVVDG